MTVLSRFGSLLIVVALLCGGTVRAQEGASKDASLDEARVHVAKAKVHYDLGEYEQAAEEYILVYRFKALPAVLFNIAQAYRQAGKYEKAKQFYKSYLRESPDAKNKAMIEQAVRDMDELLVKDKHAREKPPNGVKEPAETVLSRKQPPAQAAPPPPLPAKEPVEATPPAQVAANPASPPAASLTRNVPTTQPRPTNAAAPKATTASATSPGTTAAALAPTRGGPAPAAAARPMTSFGTRSTSTLASPPRHRTWTWVAAGASAVALGGGAVFGAKTINGASPSNARTANVLYGAGAALAIASAALFVFEF